MRLSLASEVVELLTNLIKTHGDLPVVSGVDRTGYGEPVDTISFTGETINVDGIKTPVFDLVMSDNSLVSKGPW